MEKSSNILEQLREDFILDMNEKQKNINDFKGNRHKHEGNAEKYSFMIDRKAEEYCRSVSIRKNEAQEKLREFTNSLPMGFMISCPLTQNLIQIFCGLTKAKKCLDIGVFTGSSALAMAQCIPDDGVVCALEFNEKIAKVAAEFWKMFKVDQKVKLMLGSANDSLDKILEEKGVEGTFDFAFVDADKVSYLDYYKKCKKLLKSNGVMVFDNTLWKGRVYLDDKVSNEDRNAICLRELNKFVYEDEECEVVLLPVSDGVTIIRKK